MCARYKRAQEAFFVFNQHIINVFPEHPRYKLGR